MKLVDFGLAAQLDKDSSGGKPFFMAPEIIVNGKSHPTSDLFSVGIVVYHLLSTQFPFPTQSFEAYLKWIKEQQPTAISKKINDIPLFLDQILLKLISFAPENRYQSAGEVLKDLDEFTQRPVVYSSLDFDIGNAISLSYPTWVGRDTEMKALKNSLTHTLLDSDRLKELTISMISGEPGIGKSRMLLEIENSCALSDIPVHRISLTGNGQIDAFIHFCQEKRKLKIKNPAQLTESPMSIKSAFIRELVLAFFKVVNRSHSVLFIEQGEFIKGDLWVFLSLFIEELWNLNHHLMVVITFNSDLADSWHILEKLKKKAPRFAHFQEFQLKRYQPDEARLFVNSLLPVALTDHAMEHVFNLSGGNPEYMLTLVSHLVESKQFFLQRGRVALQVNDKHPIPRSLPELVSQRIHSLSGEKRSILYIMAPISTGGGWIS